MASSYFQFQLPYALHGASPAILNKDLAMSLWWKYSLLAMSPWASSPATCIFASVCARSSPFLLVCCLRVISLLMFWNPSPCTSQWILLHHLSPLFIQLLLYKNSSYPENKHFPVSQSKTTQIKNIYSCPTFLPSSFPSLSSWKHYLYQLFLILSFLIFPTHHSSP